MLLFFFFINVLKYLFITKIKLVCLKTSQVFFKISSSFSKNFLSLFSSSIRFFWKLNWKIQILCFKNSSINCSSVMLSWSSIHRVSKMWFFSKIWFFIFSAYSAFKVTELLNFQRLFPWSILSLNSSEKPIGEWLVEKEPRTSVFLTNSCKVLDTKKKSTLCSMKLEESFWQNLKTNV